MGNNRYQNQTKGYDLRNFGGNRAKALLRDRNQCAICSTAYDSLTGIPCLVVHRRRGEKSTSLNNLLTLCKSCQAKINCLALALAKNSPVNILCKTKHLQLAIELVQYTSGLPPKELQRRIKVCSGLIRPTE